MKRSCADCGCAVSSTSLLRCKRCDRVVDLARMAGVSTSTIYAIKQRKLWAHV